MNRQAAIEILLAAATVLAAPMIVGVLYTAALEAPPSVVCSPAVSSQIDCEH